MTSAEQQVSSICEGPFAQPSSNANQNFTPVKLGSQNMSGKSLKPPKAPEKPLMPYMRYSRKIWDSVKASHQDLKLWEIGRIIGQMWRELSTSEKQKYVDEYEVEKGEYIEALKNYQNSPAYQQYLAAKEKAAAAQQQQGAEEKESTKSRNPVGQTASSSTQKAETKLGLPPIESDSVCDELDPYSLRQLGASRFHRNQRLLYEIFSESCVPDLRSIVTNPRMHMLKRQVHSLTMHQKKLENELEQLEEKFQAKKQCFLQNTEDFNQRLEQLSGPPASAQKYEEMVAKATAQLLEQYKAYTASLNSNVVCKAEVKDEEKEPKE